MFVMNSHVWENSFQAQSVTFFVMVLHVVVVEEMSGGGGWAHYRSIKWNTKMIESQRSHLGSYWTFLVLTAFQT